MSTVTRSKIKGRSQALTEGVRVQVESHFLPLHSAPDRDIYKFIYFVTIINERSRAVQLIDRHWVITDAMGHVEEVRGPGVVGETPLIGPGSSHFYHSFCVLHTPFGQMSGSYGMVSMEGDRFSAEVASFNLLTPDALH